MPTLIALLRGVNVGGKRRIRMADLRAALTAIGFDDVRTHLQSGNVVLRTADRPEVAAGRIVAAIRETSRLEVDVLVRSPDDLRRLATRNPFLDVEPELSRIHVVFLDRAPEPDAVARLDPDRSPPDVFVLEERELFVHYPNGAGRSKLTLDYLERTLGVRGTARNWKTVTALIDIAARDP